MKELPKQLENKLNIDRLSINTIKHILKTTKTKKGRPSSINNDFIELLNYQIIEKQETQNV